LILYLNVDAEVSDASVNELDDGVFGLPRQIGVVEVEDVIVLHAPVLPLAGQGVPSRLKKAPGCQKALIQTKTRQARARFRVHRIAQSDVDEPVWCQLHSARGRRDGAREEFEIVYGRLPQVDIGERCVDGVLGRLW
jgi:hypothetical protein